MNSMGVISASQLIGQWAAPICRGNWRSAVIRPTILLAIVLRQAPTRAREQRQRGDSKEAAMEIDETMQPRPMQRKSRRTD